MPVGPAQGKTGSFTPKQGLYLSFIHYYSLLNHRAPAEADMQEFFGVAAPSVHQMVLNLERAGLIRREPGRPRSIEVLVRPEQIPPLSRTPPASALRRDATVPKGKDQPELVNPAELISLQQASEFSGYSPQRLRALADSGKLKAWLIGNSWVTSRRHVEHFLRHDLGRHGARP
jgi:hypothetical protein